MNLDIENLRRRITKPLRPYFVSRTQQPDVDKVTGTYPIICCSASRQEAGDSDCYVQGAGDDTENWANGLTADTFWLNVDTLMAIESEDDLESTIHKIVTSGRRDELNRTITIGLTMKSAPLHVGTLDSANDAYFSRYDCMIACSDPQASYRFESISKLQSSCALTLNCGKGKAASRSLRHQLPRLIPFVEHVKSKKRYPSFLVTCASGKDLSIGVALTLLCLYYDDEGKTLFLNLLAGN